MIIVLRRGTTIEQRDQVVDELERLGLGIRALSGENKHLLHVVSGSTRRTRRVLKNEFVEALLRTSGPRLRKYGPRIYPYHFIRWCAAGVVLFGLMALLAGQFPTGAGNPIEIERPPETLVWPWYLRAPRELLLLFSPESRWLGWTALLGLALVTLLLPVLDRTTGEGPSRRWPFIGAALAIVIAAIYVSAGGAA